MHADGRIDDTDMYERSYGYSPRENDSGNSSRHQEMQLERETSDLEDTEDIIVNAPTYEKEVSHFVPFSNSDYGSPYNSGKKASRPLSGMDDDVDDMSSVDSEKSFRASYDHS